LRDLKVNNLSIFLETLAKGILISVEGNVANKDFFMTIFVTSVFVIRVLFLRFLSLIAHIGLLPNCGSLLWGGVAVVRVLIIILVLIGALSLFGWLHWGSLGSTFLGGNLHIFLRFVLGVIVRVSDFLGWGLGGLAVLSLAGASVGSSSFSLLTCYWFGSDLFLVIFRFI